MLSTGVPPGIADTGAVEGGAAELALGPTADDGVAGPDTEHPATRIATMTAAPEPAGWITALLLLMRLWRAGGS